MNFKEIIKQEWEKEYLSAEGQEPYEIEDSIFSIYHELVERICVRVWNQALELAAEEVDVEDYYGTNVPDRQSIRKLKINEQGTDTTEV